MSMNRLRIPVPEGFVPDDSIPAPAPITQIQEHISAPLVHEKYAAVREHAYTAMTACPHVCNGWFMDTFGLTKGAVGRLRRYLLQTGQIPYTHKQSRITEPTKEDLMKFTKVDHVPVKNGVSIRPEVQEIAEHCVQHPGESFQLDPAEALSPEAMADTHTFREQSNSLRCGLKYYQDLKGLPEKITLNMNADKKLLFVTYAKKEAAA